MDSCLGFIDPYPIPNTTGSNKMGNIIGRVIHKNILSDFIMDILRVGVFKLLGRQ